MAVLVSCRFYKFGIRKVSSFILINATKPIKIGLVNKKLITGDDGVDKS